MVNRHRMIVNSQPIAAEVSGTNSVQLSKATSLPLKALVIKGSCSQASTPTPDAPVWPVINNGTVGMARPSGLPLRYQMVEWLTVASPSNRITITGFKTNANQEFECKWYRSAQINCYLYASDASSSLTTNTTAYLATANGTWRFDGRAAGFSAPVETICTSIQSKDGVWVNGSKVGSYGNADDFVSVNDLYLLNGSDSANVRFYYLKVRENGNVVLDLVPVRDNMDGVYGVYDKISGEFYTNAETTFEVGANVEDTPCLTVDGTPEVLTMSGKNLFDVPIESRLTINARGETASNSTRSATQEYTPVDGDTTYTLSYAQSINNGVFYYNENKEFLSYLAWETKPRTFTTPTNARFVRFSFATINEITETQLELGDMMTAYEPYHTPQTTTVPDLYAVGNYKDEYDAVSGQITRRVGVKVLDGTEDWFAAKGYTDLYGVPVADGVFSANQLAISTHYAGTTAVNNVMATNTTKATHASILAPGKISVYIKDTVNGTSLEDWKAYLAAQYAAGTPIIIIYPLITPAMEQLTPQKIKAANTITTTGDLSVTYWKAPF